MSRFLMARVRKPLAGVLAAAMFALAASPVLAWWDDGWAYRTRINVSTTTAAVAGEVGRTPVLVRLHSGNFDFADAQGDGSDLRFVGNDDRTPLAFHIERWAPDEEQALVWVDVSGLEPNAVSAVYAYYGAETPPATGGQNPAATYGPDTRLVWHFDGTGAVRDATANGNNATSEVGRRNPRGLIGQSLTLDGAAGVGLPAAAIAAGEPLTVSMWVRPAAQGLNGQLLTVPGSVTLGLEGGVLYAETGGQRSAGTATLAPDTWTHVAMVASDGAVRLYVNGDAAGELAAALPAPGGAAVLGQGFIGDLDELRVTAAAVPVGALELAAASEGQGARLLTFDTAEQTESGGHDYFGILFAALTIDAWVVIVILGIMLAIAIWVMVSKGLLLSRTARANEDFLDVYQKSARASTGHDGLGELGSGFSASTLGRLYQIGRRELSNRLEEGRTTGSRHAIRPQSIAAIRSALDAGQVRESQRLNRQMVLLTIAISGGPFIGLLGTVLGVMITFASVAAAGEVNINAIAPGIAAALLATVAGLAVAIPALFGYNYLLSRVEDISADNQIFVDELEKRIAETWQDSAGPAGGPRGQDAPRGSAPPSSFAPAE